MKMKYFFISTIIGIIFLSYTVTASSSYGKIDVYYNDKILPEKEVAKPNLKINEPFKIKINMTVNNEYKVSGKLTELGKGYFEVINGPSEMNQYSSIILKANESHIFEWTVKPTDKWAGGSLPINFHYSLLEKGNPEPVVNSEFTVAYCTISNEYYEGKNSNPQDQPIKEVESPSEANPPSESAKVPAFTIASAVSALALTFFLNRR